MVEEAADRRLEVERHILVDDAVAEPFVGNLSGGDSARRQHDVDAVVEDALDQRHDGDGLADARRMDPDHRPFGTLAPGDSIALAPANSVLLAPGGAPGNIRTNQRIGGCARETIRRQEGARPAPAHFEPSTRR